MHQAAREFVAQTVAAMHLHPATVLEVGSRNINGSVRNLFPGLASYRGIDIVGGPGVSCIADGADYVAERPVEAVVCCEVLEHTPRAREIVLRAAENLVYKGVLIVTCAGPGRTPHSAMDGMALREGEFYHNVEPLEMEAWLTEAGFKPTWVELNPDAGDLYAWGLKARRKRNA